MAIIDKIEPQPDGSVVVRCPTHQGRFHRVALTEWCDPDATLEAANSYLVGAGFGPLDEEGWAAACGHFADVYEWADGNPDGEDRAGLPAVLEDGKLRLAKDGEEPLGIVADCCATVGYAGAPKWSQPCLLDDDGKPLMRDVEFVSWREPVMEDVEIPLKRRVMRKVTRPATETVEIPETYMQVVEGPDGKHREEPRTVMRQRERPKTRAVQLFNEDGSPAVGPRGDIVWRTIPIMEEVEVEVSEDYTEVRQRQVGEIEHCYRADAIPEGVTVPEDAERGTVAQPVPNPDFDESAVEVRAQALVHRPAKGGRWAAVSRLGRHAVKGDILGKDWVREDDGRVFVRPSPRAEKQG